jgi:hypothetical protein
MDEVRLGSVGQADWYSGRSKDDARKRARQQHAESQDEPVDEVILSSAAEDAEGSPDSESS